MGNLNNNLNNRNNSNGLSDAEIARLTNYNFKKEKSSKTNPHVKYAVFVTFIEIYNDRVYDLLDTTQRYGMSTQHSKKVREDEMKHAYVDGVKEVEVESIEDAFVQYYRGKERRRLAQTELNFSSSRSHSIFQIRLVHVPFDSSNGELYQDSRLLQRVHGKFVTFSFIFCALKIICCGQKFFGLIFLSYSRNS